MLAEPVAGPGAPTGDGPGACIPTSHGPGAGHGRGAGPGAGPGAGAGIGLGTGAGFFMIYSSYSIRCLRVYKHYRSIFLISQALLATKMGNYLSSIQFHRFFHTVLQVPRILFRTTCVVHIGSMVGGRVPKRDKGQGVPRKAQTGRVDVGKGAVSRGR